ncbi:MAG: SOS response-associated peptidase [Candidatus Flexifilum sp.]|jgi:putative SOS response-associated peptidase YedK
MCGRFAQVIDPEQIQQMFDLSGRPDIPARYNIAPTQQAYVILNERPLELRPLRWGLIPSWAKDAAIGSKLINARAETLEEKPSFRDAVRKRRCIVPVSGFFEWKSEGGVKQPLYIHPSHQGLLALAGLWEQWNDPASGEIVATFTIITTEANAFMRTWHERMPLILSPADYAPWLVEDDLPAIRALLKRPADDAVELTAYPVTRAVNRPTYDAPDCIIPLAG